MSAATQATVSHATRDALTAARNAFKLGSSLLLTLGIALCARVFLPRFLGPEQFGPLQFADKFATAFFVILTLGVDTYIRKEIPVRPDHGADFFGGVLALRVILLVALLGVMSLVLTAMGASPEVKSAVYAFAFAQALMSVNLSLAALLQARGTVDGLSVINVASKVLWAVGIAVALLSGAGIVGIASALLVSEAVKAAALTYLNKNHLTYRVNVSAVKGVILASLPFYLNTVFHSVYNHLDVSLLSVMSTDKEVGWYGAATNLAGITLMVTPLIGWILLPLYSRAAARSDEEFNSILRRSLELILTLAFPTSLMIGLGADVWIRMLFGEAFAPAALSLRILAPTFLVTYVASVSATSMIRMHRAWTMTLISFGGLVLNPVLNFVFIPPASRILPIAGAGAGAALAQVLTELAVTAAMMVFIGRRAFDRRSLGTIAKTILVCAVVILVDQHLLFLGPWRLIVDLLVYIALALATRAVRIDEVLHFSRTAFRHDHDQ